MTQTNNPIIQKSYSIEEGFFVFTMMPSLRCSLNCPHCYLSLDQRRNSDIMKLEDLAIICGKVNDYYMEKMGPDKAKTIAFYWYGGEPTEMGLDYMNEAFDIIESIYTPAQGYKVEHIVLSSLITVSEEWFEFFKDRCDGKVQTSFDGFMRGKNYVKKWEKKVLAAVDYGLKVSTLSVVNHEMIEIGGKGIMDYLNNLNVVESGFLPFMLNDQNEGDKYGKFAPTMNRFSDFMIDLSRRWNDLKEIDLSTPHVGTINYILGRDGAPARANVAGQTLFLMPNGDFCLPDYRNGHHEYMRVFGNILKDDFKTVLTSKERRDYIRKQYLRNGNKDCVRCEEKNNCLMEFWKENKVDDDCFGAKKYINWLKDNVTLDSEQIESDRAV